MQKIKDWINEQRQAGKAWEWLINLGQSNIDTLQGVLDFQSSLYGWPNIRVSEWEILVNEQREESESEERIDDLAGDTTLKSDDNSEDNEITVDETSNSAWTSYRKRLEKKGFTEHSINEIKKSSIKILRHLSRDTRDIEARKGLVVGNVQSGKTAHMAALISMASDSGWNMFIILTGMIENLRIQTQERLRSDLSKFDRDCNSRYNWKFIDNPEGSAAGKDRLALYNFEDKSKDRHVLVCLKNYRRLSNLLGWLKRGGQNRGNLRILIIDDEADQASINTNKKNNRTTINKYIGHLVNNRNEKGKAVDYKFGAMNYIGYTATPFANILSEGPGENSLYPSAFIKPLETSDEYFGPQQIFGHPETQYDGMNIIRNVTEDDIDKVKEIHEGQISFIPSSLKEAVCWFLCGVACMRSWGYDKPVSMLIHTSRLTQHHDYIYKAIESWFNNTKKEIIFEECKRIWLQEREHFTVDDFKIQYHDYGKHRGEIQIKDYPEFYDIESYLKEILQIGVSKILIDDKEGELIYSKGVNICVDNSDIVDEPDTIKRLVYPSNPEAFGFAPAFIIIGGQTLSRGLTIEGLISTFFLRTAMAADTLMQMGRWFGYRPGYEMLPRIWMSELAKEQFEYLSDADYYLRKELQEIYDNADDLTKVAPRIKTSIDGIIKVVAPNKGRGAIVAEYDFSGHTKETGIFKNDIEILTHNLQHAGNFIENLGKPSSSEHFNKHNYLWEGIELKEIISFLEGYTYSPRMRGFNDLKPMIDWLKKFTEEDIIKEWNVILAGTQRGNNKWSPVEGISINKIDRTKIKDDDENLNIKVLRSPADFFSDVKGLSEEESKELTKKINISHEQKYLNNIRAQYGLETTPQLLIYVINKDSTPLNSKERFPLNAKEDIVGFSINIPGQKSGSMVRALKLGLETDYTDIH